MSERFKRKPHAVLAYRLDALCARLNDGLAAVAIALAIVTAVTLLRDLPPPRIDAETGIFIDEPG